MNFFQPVSPDLMPWTSNPAFLVAMAIFLLLPIGMYIWMRNRGWMWKDDQRGRTKDEGR
jgi:hypothetical protein